MKLLLEWRRGHRDLRARHAIWQMSNNFGRVESDCGVDGGAATKARRARDGARLLVAFGAQVVVVVGRGRAQSTFWLPS